jgi:hypothetical protein
VYIARPHPLRSSPSSSLSLVSSINAVYKADYSCNFVRAVTRIAHFNCNIDDTNKVGNNIDDNINTIDKSNTSINETIVDNNTIIVRVNRKRGRKPLIIAPWQLHVMLHVLIE